MPDQLCVVCNTLSPLENFYGTRRACKPCVKRRSLAWNQSHSQLVRDRHVVRNARPEIIEAKKIKYHANRDALLRVRRDRPADEKRAQSRRGKLKRYGITEHDYSRMLMEQGGVCRICGVDRSQRKWDRYLFIDHDHSTKKVRGLLCHHCNAGLGHFKDDATLLTKAMRYLNEQN